LGAPFCEPLDDVGVRDARLLLARLDTAPDQVGDIEVVLHVFDRAVIRELVEHLLNLLLRVDHRGAVRAQV
jgi:hypothetical protein